MGNEIKVTKFNPPVLAGFTRKVLYEIWIFQAQYDIATCTCTYTHKPVGGGSRQMSSQVHSTSALPGMARHLDPNSHRFRAQDRGAG